MGTCQGGGDQRGQIINGAKGTTFSRACPFCPIAIACPCVQVHPKMWALTDGQIQRTYVNNYKEPSCDLSAWRKLPKVLNLGFHLQSSRSIIICLNNFNLFSYLKFYKNIETKHTSRNSNCITYYISLSSFSQYFFASTCCFFHFKTILKVEGNLRHSMFMPRKEHGVYHFEHFPMLILIFI